MQRAFTSILFYTLPLATFSCLIPLSARAQVTPDGTTSTTVNQDGNNFTIEQGDRVGDNLFHSFNQFSVPTSGLAAFNNAGDIANIFSRVTGSSISSIDGLISANGAANLFLINPNGIVFGENASLNLNGSFFASTADSLLFEGNTEFSAVNPQAAPLLEVSIPIGLNFRNEPGDITVQSISTPEAPFITSLNAKLVFLGGNVSFESAQINALGRTVELGGLATAGTITLNNDLSLSFPNNVTRGDVVLNNAAFIDVSSGGGGNININARNLELTQGALFAGIRPNFGNPEAQAGDININATREVNLRQASSINNFVDIDGMGNSGDININTGSLNLTEGNSILASTFANGNTGIISIKALDEVSVAGQDRAGFTSGIFSQVVETAQGNAGGIEIATSNLTLTNGGQINTSTLGNGNGGGINITASDTISADGTSQTGDRSGIFSTVQETAEGDAGEVEITTSNLTLTNGALIDASTLGNGNGGGINTTASDTISADGTNQYGFPSGIFSTVQETAEGDAGEVEITTNKLSLTNEGTISASTFGEGDASLVKINASDSILTDGSSSGIFSNVDETGQGDAGGINITTSNLTLTNGGQIDASTWGNGNAGGINITALDTISADGTNQDGDRSGIFSSVEETAEGDAGEVEITTNKLSLTNEGVISASTFGEGDASLVKINASDSILIDGYSSGIFSRVGETAQGNADGIEIATENLTLTNGGRIDASTFGNGNAGGINLTASDTISVGQNQAGFTSGIFSAVDATAQGDAGGIEITTSNLTLTNGGRINASTNGNGNAGGINITASDTISAEGTSQDGFPSGIFSGVAEAAEGNAGGINITTSNLTLTNKGKISVSTFGEGDASLVKINASDSILIDSYYSGIFSRVGETAQGNAGAIEIATENLTLTNGGRIDASTFGEGDASLVKINASDSILTDGFPSGIFSLVGIAQGNAGGIEIATENLTLTNGGEINTSTFGEGDAGGIKITASDTISVAGQNQAGFTSGIVSTVEEIAEGNSGGIEIATENLTLSDEAQINIALFGKTNPEIQSGNLNLTVEDFLILRNSAKISAQATGNSNGGNVTINANDGLIIAFPNQNNDIFANAAQGNGGNINIFTQAIFGLEERSSTPPNQTNDIDASSELGLQGTFSLNTPDFDPTTGLINLPASVGDASDQISQNPCQRGVGSEFLVTGKGGLPPNVNESLNSESAQVGLIESVPSQQTVGGNGIHPNPSTTPEAVPAQGWVFNDKGEVTLTAYKNTNTQIKRSLPATSNSCSALSTGINSLTD